MPGADASAGTPEGDVAAGTPEDDVAAGTPESDRAQGAPLSPTEEALVGALAEVDRLEGELKAIEPLRERLRSELREASAEAEALINQVNESYARERLRLEAELQLVQKRAASLERILETRLHREGAAKADRSRDPIPDPLPSGSAPFPQPEVASPQPGDAPPASDARAKGNGKAKKLGVVKAMNRNTRGRPGSAATEAGSSPDAELPTAPEARSSSLADAATGPHGDGPGVGTSGSTAAPVATESAKGDSTSERETAAYEDHWYQVLRRDSLGGPS
jgi:hypothetical protein